MNTSTVANLQVVESKASGWIKVSERLPDKNAGQVLVWNKEWGGMGTADCEGMAVIGWMDDELWSYDNSPKPTHWMPMPLPPSESEQ